MTSLGLNERQFRPCTLDKEGHCSEIVALKSKTLGELLDYRKLEYSCVPLVKYLDSTVLLDELNALRGFEAGLSSQMVKFDGGHRMHNLGHIDSCTEYLIGCEMFEVATVVVAMFGMIDSYTFCT